MKPNEMQNHTNAFQPH